MHARTVQLAINQLKHLVISLSRVMSALKTDHEMNLNQEILKHFCNTEKNKPARYLPAGKNLLRNKMKHACNTQVKESWIQRRQDLR
jgi:hypothetical protein